MKRIGVYLLVLCIFAFSSSFAKLTKLSRVLEEPTVLDRTALNNMEKDHDVNIATLTSRMTRLEDQEPKEASEQQDEHIQVVTTHLSSLEQATESLAQSTKSVEDSIKQLENHHSDAAMADFVASPLPDTKTVVDSLYNPDALAAKDKQEKDADAKAAAPASRIVASGQASADDTANIQAAPVEAPVAPPESPEPEAPAPVEFSLPDTPSSPTIAPKPTPTPAVAQPSTSTSIPTASRTLTVQKAPTMTVTNKSPSPSSIATLLNKNAVQTNAKTPPLAIPR
jgi:myosin heavy subunit